MTQLTPTPSYSLALHLQLSNQPGKLATVIEAIAEQGGNVGQIDLIAQDRHRSIRALVVDAASQDHAEQIVSAIKTLADVELLAANDRTFALHQGGKIEIYSTISLKEQSSLAMAYTPGVGRISQAIAERPDSVFDLTIKGNMVAIVSDGSAILGLGNLGPEAALPVMEGKALLLKGFAEVDAFPICLATQDTDEIVKTVKYLAPVFGGINLEDISAPRCFEIERRLRQELDIPVFHDDQHGTAIVTLAALLNALKVVEKAIDQVKIVFNGAGAAGIAVAKLLRLAGAKTLWMCDSKGIISSQRDNLTPEKQDFAVDAQGTLADAVQDADVFVGLSVSGVLTPEMVSTMGDRPIVFAMANPIPEIQPELVQGQVAVMATGRSDYANQINNVLAFPGIFRGALDCRAKEITQQMCLKAAEAIAALVAPQDLNAEQIIPSVFDERVAPAVAEAVMQAARAEGTAQA
ncbi:MAG: NAD-dependent malic enzyme [Cyanobacteria bacterium P01_G01_bin.54]